MDDVIKLLNAQIKKIEAQKSELSKRIDWVFENSSSAQEVIKGRKRLKEMDAQITQLHNAITELSN